MQNYDPDEAPDPEEWLALDEQERIGLVRDYHRAAGIRLPNATMHATLHAIVETQIALGDDTPADRTAERLIDDGLDRHDAIHAIGMVLAQHIYEGAFSGQRILGRCRHRTQAFAQVTYNGPAAGVPPDPFWHALSWDNVDVRYANQASIGFLDIIYGITACTPAVRRLARVVLGPMGGRPLLAPNPQPRGTVRQEEDDAILEPVLDHRWPQGGGLSAADGPASDPHGRMDSDGPMPEMVDGVLSLQHRQGHDLSGNRYIRKTVELRSESMTVARSTFVYDQCDHRAQIPLLAVTSAEFYGRAVAATLRSIESVARGEHFSAFADVRADALDVQACLESTGFVPTVYFPAMIAVGARRQDIVQYTYLHKLPLTAAVASSTTLNWPDVERVVDLIIDNCEVGNDRALFHHGTMLPSLRAARDQHLGIRPVSQVLS